jgi:hypothetical protein
MNVDVFIIFEELQKSKYGEDPPTPKKDSCEFLEANNKDFIKCYHIVAVHPTAQVYIVWDLHLAVHGGLWLVLGDKRQQECAQLVMDGDPKLSQSECDKNVLESVSGLSNIYLKNSNDDMFATSWEADVVLDHDSNRMTPTRSKRNKQSNRRTKFWLWGIPEK